MAICKVCKKEMSVGKLLRYGGTCPDCFVAEAARARDERTGTMLSWLSRWKERKRQRVDDEIVRRVAYLVGYLRQFRRNATVDRQAEYEELRRIGYDLDARGGIELMRQVAHRMAPLVTPAPSPYVRDQVKDSLSDINDYWNGIGGWQA